MIGKRLIGGLAAGVAGALALTACGGGSSSTGGDSGPPSGKITVLTNRTDLDQDGTLKKYAADFHKVYPKVDVTFQALTDYAGEVKIRMNSSNYGDVLLIPTSVQRSDYPRFFEPLGTAADLDKKYNWIDTTTTDGTLGGKAYGIATFGNANGFVYNKAVWKQAGITTDPTTPQEFLTDLQAIKAKTGATPLYTNYHDGWPLQGFGGALGSATCDPDASSSLASDKAPWSQGKGLGIIDTTLFDAVRGKLIEPDPTTTNWEGSKSLLATGKVGTMWLGSWAVTQMRAAAKEAGADPANIGLMPFPAQKDGKFCPVTGPDYNQAVNIHSDHKAAAKAWIDWFTNKSGFATAQGSIPTVKGAAYPATFADYQALGANYISLSQKDAGVVSKIDNQSEIGFMSSPTSWQSLVDTARGQASGSLDSLFSEWNKKWAQGISDVGQ